MIANSNVWHSKVAHPSSVDRFSENFDKKAETCLIFFLGMHWFQKCNFWKKSLSSFRGRWAQEVIFEVAEAKFWISPSFHLEFSSFWISRSFDLGDLGVLRRGPGNFFKNYIFEISAFQRKRWGMSQLSRQNFH